MSFSPGTARAPSQANWPAGLRGLAAGLALLGMSQTQGWLVYPAGAVMAYSLAAPLSLGTLVLSRSFLTQAATAAAALAAFVALFVSCALMVNAPVQPISIAGGIAMILLLATAITAAAYHLARTLLRKAPAARHHLRHTTSLLHDRLTYARMLLALQFDPR